MPEHKLEPGQMVLVRSDVLELWRLRHFSHYKAEGYNFVVIGSSETFNSYQFCIPYNAKTKHLHNTKQPYVAATDAHNGGQQMSTVEISKEERDLWRFEASDNCGTPSDEDERILRLLEAFEACEADLERSCEETRANEVVPELKRRIAEAEARAEKAEAENARLRERLESALDKIADIQENGEEEGACHACGICAGCPEDWQPTDDHNCRVMLELWADGEPLPWEAARRAVAAGEE